jgi:hypothetical protein
MRLQDIFTELFEMITQSRVHHIPDLADPG